MHLPIVTILFWVRLIDNAKLKEAYLHAVLGGVHKIEIACWTDRFLNEFLHQEMYPDGLATVEMHRRAGDTVILVTASPDCYVIELAHRLGFHEVICTQIEWKEGRLSGRLASPNMRGHEKVLALQDIRSRYRHRPVTAYGDQQSDLPMLQLADHGVLVNGGRRAKEVALREGIHCCMWGDGKDGGSM